MRALWPFCLILLGCNDDFLLPAAEVDTDRVTTILALSGSVPQGRTAFEEHCLICHDISGEVAGAGPALNGVFDRITDEEAVGVIIAGRGTMPAIDVSDDECADLIAFMKDEHTGTEGDGDGDDDDDTDADTDDTDPPGPDGQSLYESSCQGCHPASGDPGVGPGFSTLIPATDEPTIRDSIENGRPGMPSFDFEPDELDALVAYLQATW